MKKIINTPDAPAAVGPYSQAMIHGNTLYTSGQIPLNPATGKLAGETIEEQTHQVFKNLIAVLAAANATLQDAIKVNIYIKDMNDFAVVNGIYATYFAEPYPARACVEVARLPMDVLIEIELTADLEGK